MTNQTSTSQNLNDDTEETVQRIHQKNSEQSGLEETSAKHDSNQPNKDSLAPVTSFTKTGRAPHDSVWQKTMESQTGNEPNNNDPSIKSIKVSDDKIRELEQEVRRLKEIEKEYFDMTGQTKYLDASYVKRWWKNLYPMLKQGTHYDSEHLKVIRCYPEDIIRLLFEINQEEEKQKDSLFNWSHKKDKEIEELKQQQQGIKTELRKKEDQIKKLKEANVELEQRRTMLLKDITALKTGGVSTPQHETLYSTFKELKDQEFKEFGTKAFNLLRSEYRNSTGLERKLEIARIRSLLAESILIKGVEISEQSGSTPEQKVVKLSEYTLNRFTTYLNTHGCQSVAAQCPGFKEIEQDLKGITRKAFELVNKIVHALPAAKLLWYEKKDNVRFNPEEHEELQGCVEGGEIEFTVYPGYAVQEGNSKKRRIFEKAVVFTTLESKKY